MCGGNTPPPTLTGVTWHILKLLICFYVIKFVEEKSSNINKIPDINAIYMKTDAYLHCFKSNSDVVWSIE